jgi:hypothetical protein
MEGYQVDHNGNKVVVIKDYDPPVPQQLGRTINLLHLPSTDSRSFRKKPAPPIQQPISHRIKANLPKRKKR